MNLRKEIRRTLKEVRIKQEVNVKIKFVPDDAGSAGYFMITEEDNDESEPTYMTKKDMTFNNALNYFRELLKNMASNSL